MRSDMLAMKNKREVERSRCPEVGVAILAVALLLAGGCQGVVDTAAEAEFRERLGSISLSVYPTFVRTGEEHAYDLTSAETVAAFFNDEGLATATVGSAQVPIESGWQMNQHNMLRESLGDFQAYVRENPPTADYVLLMEYLKGSEDSVGGIHAYLLDPEARVAYVIGLNSHQDAFSSVDPHTTEDCTEVILIQLREDLLPLD
jgi:hypothetical protein